MAAAFGSAVPFAEPAWYRAGHTSPYYNDSHRLFREKMRVFVERELIPHVEEWDEAGAVPDDIPARAYEAGVWSPCWEPQKLGFVPHGHPASSPSMTRSL